MEIRNGKLRLSQDDIENIIAQRIKEIQDKLDESYYKIKNGEISPNNIDITMLDEKDYKNSDFNGTFEEFKDEQVVSFVKKYIMALKNNKRIPPSVFDFLKRTVKKNAVTCFLKISIKNTAANSLGNSRLTSQYHATAVLI